jgi:hypothetical protein
MRECAPFSSLFLFSRALKQLFEGNFVKLLQVSDPLGVQNERHKCITTCIWTLLYISLKHNFIRLKCFMSMQKAIRTSYCATESITVVARSEAWTVFADSNAGDRLFEFRSRHGWLCVRLFCVCVVLCVGSSLETGWSVVRGFLPTV